MDTLDFEPGGSGIFRSFYKATSAPEVVTGAKEREASSFERLFEGGVRWRLVLFAGVLAGVAPFVVSIFLINVYATTEWFANEYFDGVVERMTGSGGISGFGVFLAHFGTPAFSLAAAILSALFAGRRVGPSAPLHGALIGVVAVLSSHLMTVPFFGPPEPYEWVIYPVVLIGGGVLGGLRGWGIRAGEEALHRANRAVGMAQSPRDIVGAVGENLTGSNINGVSLWALRRGEPGNFESLGSWKARKTRELPPEMGFGSTRELARLGSPIRRRTADLSGPDKAAWEARGIKSALLLPLGSPGEAFAGLMMITSGKSRGFSRRDERAYSTVAATAALALENLRLIEEARQAGERAGVLDERQRLAHEIHDTLAQGFTSIVTNLEAAEGSLYSGRSGAKQHLDNARAIARESLKEARRLVWALRPQRLE
ncbi:MAG: histidine kinase dimerization/phosphoacceptor domain-containing protein, partial [Rubrobacteraceae bacterium]